MTKDSIEVTYHLLLAVLHRIIKKLQLGSSTYSLLVTNTSHIFSSLPSGISTTLSHRIFQAILNKHQGHIGKNIHIFASVLTTLFVIYTYQIYFRLLFISKVHKSDSHRKEMLHSDISAHWCTMRIIGKR